MAFLRRGGGPRFLPAHFICGRSPAFNARRDTVPQPPDGTAFGNVRLAMYVRSPLEDSTAQSAGNLAAALAHYDVQVPPDQAERLTAYCQALWDWNARLNLTRHVTYDQFVARDLVDSMALAEQIETSARVLDVGTGGGVPGVVLAILRPDLRVALCESVGKKHHAVADIVATLGLAMPAYHERAEVVLKKRRFATLVARAVAPLPKMLRWLAPRRTAFGQLLVIKGSSWQAECQEAAELGLLDRLEVDTIATYTTPGSEAANVILRIRSRRKAKG
jgi:16S rRNA (guanine527-N7)-methyltransferase